MRSLVRNGIRRCNYRMNVVEAYRKHITYIIQTAGIMCRSSFRSTLLGSRGGSRASTTSILVEIFLKMVDGDIVRMGIPRGT